MYAHHSFQLGDVKFIGLSPSDTRPSKNLGVLHPFTKRRFEDYVNKLVEQEDEFTRRIKDEVALLIHDLRRFSNSIYQNAVATKKAIENYDAAEAQTRIDNTLAAQAMLRIRTDILDMIEGDADTGAREDIPAFKKFDKVVKSFKPGCALKQVDISIKGSSYSLTFGPDCVEIIAYVLVDNALKYSPRNSSISVQVRETDKIIRFAVSSLGPQLEPDEVDAIFRKGFRSKAAQKIESSGTGFGLYLAHRLVSRFNGRIWAEQSGSPITTDRGTFRDVQFIVELPISRKLSRPSPSAHSASTMSEPKNEPWVKTRGKSKGKRRRGQRRRVKQSRDDARKEVTTSKTS